MSNTNKSSTSKTQKAAQQANFLETLKDLGQGTVDSLKDDLIQETVRSIPQQFWRRPMPNRSGELKPGQNLEMDKVVSGEQEKQEKSEKQQKFILQLTHEQTQLVESQGRELKIQLNALQQEMQALAQTTVNLDEEIKVAAMQAPVNPGIYHIIFLEKIIEFIKSFRKKAQKASVWLGETNKRAQKKDYWARYKKGKGSFLLAPDHYLTRSAG